MSVGILKIRCSHELAGGGGHHRRDGVYWLDNFYTFGFDMTEQAPEWQNILLGMLFVATAVSVGILVLMDSE